MRLLMFLLTLPVAYALDVNMQYVYPLAALLVFFVIFFLVRKQIAGLMKPKKIVKKQDEHHTKRAHYRPQIAPQMQRRKTHPWKTNMKFIFAQFQGIPSKNHIKPKNPFKQLNDMIKRN